MNKKQACILLAVVASICCLLAGIATVIHVVAAIRAGTGIPMGMLLLTGMTGLCAGMIWKGVGEIEN